MTESFDLLFRGIEITTGGMRIHKYDEIIQKMKKRNMDTTGFKFFTDSHLYGLPPHGGFGMGLERLTQKIVGLNNVKEATMFPRDISRLTP
jgi:nondiscriminating aspartyl-tRNA synthetase